MHNAYVNFLKIISNFLKIIMKELPFFICLFVFLKKKIKTFKKCPNFRKFLARRRWQRCGQAIRAMKRMSGKYYIKVY